MVTFIGFRTSDSCSRFEVDIFTRASSKSFEERVSNSDASFLRISISAFSRSARRSVRFFISCLAIVREF